MSESHLVLELPRDLVPDVPPVGLGRCEIDPEMYRIFAHAVLGWHRRLPKAGGDVCQCGKAWSACEYVNLADDLLWAAPVMPRR